MKKAMRKWMIGAFFLISMFAINTSKAQGSVSLQVFYDELQPYGNWINHNSYGYVWIPNVDRDFTPYASNGYWVNTEFGNTWVSDYDWGWAPFHYGRWFYDDYNSWMWVPDTQWAPAWVAWRSGGGYYGWAPLMPGLSINVSFNYYNNIPQQYWSFVPYRYITYHTIHQHCVSRQQVINIINQTTIVNNSYNDGRRNTFFTGPSRSEMERSGHERVPIYTINDRSRPSRSDIDRGSVSFYKPEINTDHHGRTQPVPSHIARDNHIRNGKQEGLKSGGQRSSEFRDRQTDQEKPMNETIREYQRQQTQPDDQQMSRNASDRFQQSQQRNESRSFDNSNQKLNQEQRSSQTKKQTKNHESIRDYYSSYHQQRSVAQSQQHLPQRQSTSDQGYQRQHSNPNQSNGQSSWSQPKRTQQVRSSSFDHQRKLPSSSTGESKGSASRKRH